MLRQLWTGFVDSLYPRLCHLCGAGIDDDGPGCAQHALAAGDGGPRCASCADELAAMLPDGELCPACRRERPAFARVVCLGRYRSGLAEWVLALKHGGRRELSEPLGVLLAAELARAGAQGLLVPVPLHSLRRWERGYDQAALLARELALHTGLPLARALRRTRATRAQGSALALSRASNVRGAFAPRRFAARRVRGREVWLVDDVLTSGSTADECARVLLRAGAVRVSVAVLARAARAGEALSPS